MKDSYFVIPEDFLAKISEKQDLIIAILEDSRKKKLNGYINEMEARSLFNKKATWFWQKRREGLLPFSRIGRTIYYSMEDLERILKESKTKSNT
jgi:hypothetical protein